MVSLVGQLAEKPSTEVASTQKAENSHTVANTISREAHGEFSSTVTQTVSNEIGGDATGRFEAQPTYRRRLTGDVSVHYGKKKGGHYFWPPSPRSTLIFGCGAGMAPGRGCMTPCGRRRARRPSGLPVPMPG